MKKTMMQELKEWKAVRPTLKKKYKETFTKEKLEKFRNENPERLKWLEERA